MKNRTPAHVSQAVQSNWKIENDHECVQAMFTLSEQMGMIQGALMAQDGDIDLGLLYEAISFGLGPSTAYCPLTTRSQREASESFMGVLDTLQDMYGSGERDTPMGRLRPEEQRRLFQQFASYQQAILEGLNLDKLDEGWMPVGDVVD